MLEDIRSQNRATLQAVETSRAVLMERIDRFEERTEYRFAAVEAAVRSTNVGLARFDQESRLRDAALEVAIRDVKVSVQQNSVDIRALTGKVEAMSRLEERGPDRGTAF